MIDSYGTNVDASDAHFDKLCLFSEAEAEKVGNPKYFQTVKR
jgi:hypothetical protein